MGQILYNTYERWISVTTFLYWIVELIARCHTLLMSLNDAYEYNFTDKELHFLIIGVLGMLLLFAVHPLFVYLARRDHVLSISWIYVFTLMIVLTFAIEIGQGFTHTGTMDFDDIMFGLIGFLAFYLVFVVIRAIVRLIFRLIRRLTGRSDDDEF